MVGKSKDPKGTRITVRISDKDLGQLQAEARRKNITVGAVVRNLIRGGLPPVEVEHSNESADAESESDSASG
jgi:hypothetical protein